MELRAIELLNEIKGLIQNKVSDRWLSIREVCEYASISESTVRRAIKRGSLLASNQTGRLLFKVSNVDKWLNG
jgi:excisionase family DNA binding protein